MRLPLIANVEFKPGWLRQAEAADRYNLEASRRQDGEDDGFVKRRRETEEERYEMLLCMYHWAQRRGDQNPIDAPFEALSRESRALTPPS